jgi:hypothetical protein
MVAGVSANAPAAKGVADALKVRVLEICHMWEKVKE